MMDKHVLLDGRLHYRKGLGTVHRKLDTNPVKKLCPSALRNQEIRQTLRTSFVNPVVSQKKNGKLWKVLMASLT